MAGETAPDPDRAAAMAEAYKRGLLPPDMKAAYEEAIDRGIVSKPAGDLSKFMTTPQPQAKPAPYQVAEKPKGIVDSVVGFLDEPFIGDASKKTSVGERIRRGVMDPIIGLGQLEAHAGSWIARKLGADKVADNIEASTKRSEDALATNEASYQQGRRAAAPRTVENLVRDEEGDPGVDWARLGGNVASPINYVPLGAVGKIGQAAVLAKRAEPVMSGLIRSVARNAATTGTGGAVIASLNPVTGGDFWDEKTKQAAVGLAAGTVAPPIFAAGSKALIKAGSATVAPLVRYVAGIKGPQATLTAAEKEIMRRLSDGTAGGGPTAQDMLDLATRTPDKPLTLMDVGSQPVNALAGRVYRSGGAAKQRIGDALVDRTAAQGQRLEEDVGKGLSAQKAYSTTDAMMQSRANAATPLYKDAYEANQKMATPEIQAILGTDAGQKAFAAARTKMDNDMAAIGRGTGKSDVGLNLRTLDYTKRAMDDMIGRAQRAGESDDVRVLTGLKSKLVAAMDNADATAERDAAGNITKPGLYKQARAAYSGPSQSMEALEFGQNALKPSTSIDENAARFKELNANDQEFARIGLAQSLRDMIGKKDVGTNAARTLARNPAVQARIRPFFESNAKYKKFLDSVTAEDNMFHAVNRTMGGSQTAERAAEDNSADANAMAHAAHAGIHLSSGNVIGGGASLWRAISEYVKRPNPELADEMSKLLTAPLNQHGSPGMKLLRDFSAVAPGTKNYLSQATNRAARAVTVPTGVVSGQAAQP